MVLEPVSRELRARLARGEWSGTCIEGYRLDALLCEGPYSWVFKGVNTDDGSAMAFKVAKPLELSGSWPNNGERQTRAVLLTTGGVSNVTPDPDQLLALQSESLRRIADQSIVSVTPVAMAGSTYYMKMEYIEGSTLRAVAAGVRVPM